MDRAPRAASNDPASANLRGGTPGNFFMKHALATLAIFAVFASDATGGYDSALRSRPESGRLQQRRAGVRARTDRRFGAGLLGRQERRQHAPVHHGPAGRSGQHGDRQPAHPERRRALWPICGAVVPLCGPGLLPDVECQCAPGLSVADRRRGPAHATRRAKRPFSRMPRHGIRSCCFRTDSPAARCPATTSTRCASSRAGAMSSSRLFMATCALPTSSSIVSAIISTHC